MRRRPLTWTLQLLCRGRFVYPFYVCGLAHFEYCRRRDPTRNLVADGMLCEEYGELCVGPREYCEDYLFDRLDEISDYVELEAERRCLIECFGVEAEAYGTALSTEDLGYYCCYHRCDMNWRCARWRCSFTKTSPPEELEVRPR